MAFKPNQRFGSFSDVELQVIQRALDNLSKLTDQKCPFGFSLIEELETEINRETGHRLDEREKFYAQEED